MKIEKRPFKASDFDGGEWLGTTSRSPAVLSFHEKAYPNVTGLVDGEIVACGGIHVIGKGVGEIWCAMKKDAGPHVFLEVRNQLNEWIHDYGFHRIQAIVDYLWKPGRRFAEWCGMEYEGRLRQMTPNKQDMAIYARIT